MAIQIADTMIADKVDRVSKATGLSMNAVVELALDLWLTEMSSGSDQSERMAAQMAQLDGIRGHARSFESIDWDDYRFRQ
jgi:hypothetical protein